MRLVDLSWMSYRIPFRAAFRTAHGPLRYRSGVIVSICTDSGHAGNGEVAPLPEHSGTGLDAALRVLPDLARELRGQDLVEVLHFLEVQNQDGRLPSALICGLETALLDASGRASGQSLAELLASGYPYAESSLPTLPRTSIPVNAVIGGETLEETVARAQAALKAGFTCLKLKLAGASAADCERVAAVRDAIGPAPRLRLDANEGWDLTQAEFMLDRCAAYDIQYVEQPLPASNLSQMARLRRTSPIPVAADEALTGLASTRRILDAEAADVLILKPQLAGGLRACQQIIQEASKRRVTCVVTSTLESGVGVAAALHLVAATPEITLPCGLATLDLLENDLLLERLPICQGWIEIPLGPGLGVALDNNMLQRYSR